MSHLFFKLIKFQINKNFNLNFAKNTNQHDAFLGYTIDKVTHLSIEKH